MCSNKAAHWLLIRSEQRFTQIIASIKSNTCHDLTLVFSSSRRGLISEQQSLLKVQSKSSLDRPVIHHPPSLSFDGAFGSGQKGSFTITFLAFLIIFLELLILFYNICLCRKNLGTDLLHLSSHSHPQRNTSMLMSNIIPCLEKACHHFPTWRKYKWNVSAIFQLGSLLPPSFNTPSLRSPSFSQPPCVKLTTTCSHRLHQWFITVSACLMCDDEWEHSSAVHSQPWFCNTTFGQGSTTQITERCVTQFLR